MSKLSDKMQKEVKAWKSSNLTKGQFLKDKPYSKSKFEYWINKQNTSESPKHFKEIEFPDTTEAQTSKILEIESPSGIKITVFG